MSCSCVALCSTEPAAVLKKLVSVSQWIYFCFSLYDASEKKGLWITTSRRNHVNKRNTRRDLRAFRWIYGFKKGRVMELGYVHLGVRLRPVLVDQSEKGGSS